MEVLKLKISTLLQDKLIAYLAESILFQYTDISPEMTVLAVEEYYFRNNSDQLNLIIIKRVDSYLHIDLIGGGGASGLFGITWGSEQAFIKKIKKMLQDFCKTHGESIEYRE